MEALIAFTLIYSFIQFTLTSPCSKHIGTLAPVIPLCQLRMACSTAPVLLIHTLEQMHGHGVGVAAWTRTKAGGLITARPLHNSYPLAFICSSVQPVTLREFRDCRFASHPNTQVPVRLPTCPPMPVHAQPVTPGPSPKYPIPSLLHTCLPMPMLWCAVPGGAHSCHRAGQGASAVPAELNAAAAGHAGAAYASAHARWGQVSVCLPVRTPHMPDGLAFFLIKTAFFLIKSFYCFLCIVRWKSAWKGPPMPCQPGGAQ